MADKPYLDDTGLLAFWLAIKNYISGAVKVTGVKGNSEGSYRTGNVNITKDNIGLSNVENKSSETIRGELTKSNVTTALGYTPPSSDTNTTYSLTQDATDGHKITLTPSSGTAQTVTIPDNNTWRGIQNNLTSDSTSDSLSAAQGKALANGSARDNTKLPLSGGTMTGALNVANNTWNKIGDDVQIGDINEAGTLGVQGLNGNTGIRFTTYNQSTKTTGGKIVWDGSKFNIGGYTLEKSVPSNAVFTDTKYSTMSSSEITTGTATTPRTMTAKDLRAGILDLFYPVGSWYITSKTPTEFNPATAWGGTWEYLQEGIFLCSAGTSDAYKPVASGTGAKGGANSVTLTAAQTGMKSHSHQYTKANTATNGKALTANQLPKIEGSFSVRKYANTSGDAATQISGRSGVFTSSTGSTTTYGINSSSAKQVGETDVKLAFGNNETHAHDIGSSTQTTFTNPSDANATSAHENRPLYKPAYMWHRTK